ncbi:hypothetical protein QBC36DRAFT_364812 [Triangularia setosa]|uniref:Uncharacterized protein n=1 Tax=Triangularia setosa TaxID=2587417 RepID=A0AAN6WBT6_9PEZI|nr:hypothetical protein QBC36DRAFT_364812 [Podospora setosa]
MCQGTIYDFWCPCIFHPTPPFFCFLPHGIHPPDFNFTFTHRPIADPLKATKAKTSHEIVYSQLNPAYEFCEEYLRSPTFDPREPLDMGGLCPAGSAITYQREDFISSRLCESCVMGGCEKNMEDVGVKTMKRSRYGWRSREEERERRGRRRRDRGVSPAGSTGRVGSVDALGRSRSRSVRSNRTVKENDYGSVRKADEPINDAEEVKEKLGEASLADLVEAMAKALEPYVINKKGSELSAGPVKEKGARSLSLTNWQDKPSVLTSDIKSSVLWTDNLLERDFDSKPDELMPPANALVLPQIIPGGDSLDDWPASGGQPVSEYDSDQKAVIVSPEAAEKNGEEERVDVAAVEGAKRVEQVSGSSNQSRHRRLYINRTPGQEPIHKLKFLRRGKSAARETGSFGEGSRVEEKEPIMIM